MKKNILLLLILVGMILSSNVEAGGTWKKLRPNHNHFFGSDGYRSYFPHPGWNEDWIYDDEWRPTWLRVGMVFPRFVLQGTAPSGYWQCTAFNVGRKRISDIG